VMYCTLPSMFTPPRGQIALNAAIRSARHDL